MDLEQFWAMVTSSRAGFAEMDPAAAAGRQIDALRERLSALPDDQLRDFQQRLRDQLDRAHHWRLWAAGYLAAGGMSEDAFDHFRLWLVLQGGETFDSVVADPDRLAQLGRLDADDTFAAAEDLAHLVAEELEARGIEAGEALVSATSTATPSGEPFDEDDDDWFATTFPRLWARAAAQQPGLASPAAGVRVDDDVARFPERKRAAASPRPVEPMRPALAAVLFERGQVREQDRPMVAAHWLAQDLGGEAVLELASLRGNEPEVGELWPLALREVGVALPVTDGRAAAPWAARRVLDGERDFRWLVRVLWTEWRDVDHQDDFERLVLTIDDWLDWTGRDLRSNHSAVHDRARSAREALGRAVAAMARDDVPGALRTLEEWDE